MSSMETSDDTFADKFRKGLLSQEDVSALLVWAAHDVWGLIKGLSDGAQHTDCDELLACLLLDAAEHGDEPAVQALLEAGASTDKHSKAGYTPLIAAAASGHEPVVRILLEAGADKDAKDLEHRTVMFVAADEGHKGVVNTVLEVVNTVDDACEYAQTRHAAPIFSLVLRGNDVAELPKEIDFSHMQ
ncbi:hypothetical protein CYMTET_34721, partial [Cymbomonas tetramitiformis]